MGQHICKISNSHSQISSLFWKRQLSDALWWWSAKTSSCGQWYAVFLKIQRYSTLPLSSSYPLLSSCSRSSSTSNLLQVPTLTLFWF